MKVLKQLGKITDDANGAFKIMRGVELSLKDNMFRKGCKESNNLTPECFGVRASMSQLTSIIQGMEDDSRYILDHYPNCCDDGDVIQQIVDDVGMVIDSYLIFLEETDLAGFMPENMEYGRVLSGLMSSALAVKKYLNELESKI